MIFVWQLSAIQGDECLIITQQVPRVKGGGTAEERAAAKLAQPRRPGAWETNWAKLEAP